MAQEPSTRILWQQRAATLGLLVAVLLVSLDGTIAATALPRIVVDLHGLDYYVWVTTAYLVTSTVMQPIAGKLSDIFGRRRLIAVAISGFVGGSVLAGVSQTMVALVTFRAIQGVFGGALVTVPFAAVPDLYPAEQRVKFQGIFGAVGGIGAIVGPFLGGFITDELGWRWIFYLNLPVGIAALILVIGFLPRPPSSGRWSDLDLGGSAALIAGVTPFLVALSLGGNSGWTLDLGILLLVGIAFLSAFVWIERRSARPLVPGALFKERVFSIAILIAALSGIGLYGVTFFITLLCQAVLGVSPTASGTLLMPMMLAMAVASPISGQLLVRVRHYRFVATIGLALMVCAVVLLAQTHPLTPTALVSTEALAFGFGMGLVWPISTAVIQASVPVGTIGVATSQVNFWRSLGGTAGAVALGAVFSARLGPSITHELKPLRIPGEISALFTTQGSRGVLEALDPSHFAALRQRLPLSLQPLLDQAASATRIGFGAAMKGVFILTAAILLMAMVASLFLPEVPLRTGRKSRVSRLSGGPR